MVLFQVAEHINDIKLGLTVYVVRGPAVFNTTVGLLLYNTYVTLMTLVRCRLLISKQPILIERVFFFELELIL